MPEQFEQRLQRLREAQNDPEAMALVVLDFLLDARPAGDRDLLVQAFEAAAVPHWFNVSILMKLLNQTEDKVTSLVQTLRQIPMVEDFGDPRSGNLNVHETTRLALRKRLQRHNPDRLRALSAAAFDLMNNVTSAQVVAERLYHRMTAAPDEAAKECETLFRDFPNTATPEVQHSVRAVLDELESARMLSGRARAEALLLIGWVGYIRGEITKQRTPAEEALRIATELDHKSAAARALCLIGDVAGAIGNIRNAQDNYAKSIGIFLSLMSIDGKDVGLERDLAVARSRLASALQPQGRLNEALVEAREGLRILGDIATDEDDDGLKVALSSSNSQLGALLQEQGKLSNAVAAIRASLAFLEYLTAKEPTNKSWQNRLSGVQGQLGGILQDQGHSEAALDAYTRSLDIAERVRLADPSSASSNLQVSIACSRLGGLLQENRQTTEALSCYERAFSLLEQMCRFDQENARLQREWAVIAENIGSIQQASGDRARAVKFSVSV